ncbi:MAG: FMN-binding protein [Clostridia bacterium]|nr:FMN-binding protein [Clostridiales bacterium]MDU7471685.1 FMN-binding protein [Serratia marcescens]MDU7504585.1 FMN-binding protein [Clostridia bacterium]
MTKSRKKWLVTCVVIGICLGSVIAQAEVVEADTSAATADVDSRAPGPYRNGTFTGSAPGYNGDMTVQVTIKNGWIAQTKITETKDDAEYIAKIQPLMAAVMEKQTTKTDTVSGATFSSCGFLDAVDQAIEKAKA